MECDNTSDPVADERFPNIVEYVESLDEPQDPTHGTCITATMEEVNPGDEAL